MQKYFKVIDKDIVGRQVDMFSCYLYDKQKKEWVNDTEHVLMDRIIGYDEESIGSSDMMFRLEEISEDEAMKLISE